MNKDIFVGKHIVTRWNCWTIAVWTRKGYILNEWQDTVRDLMLAGF